MAHCTDTEPGDGSEAEHGSELSDNDECQRSTATQHNALSTAGTHC